MSKYAKAFGAAAGGGAAGLAGAVALLPDGSPWYAYVLVIAIAALAPMLSAYLSPRNTPAAIFALMPAVGLALLLTACGGISERIDQTTGVPLEQRCANYRASVDQWGAYRTAGGEMTSERQMMLAAARSFIALNCPMVTPPAVDAPAPAG